MKERIAALLLFLLAALTIWAIASALPKKDYATPAADFTEAIRTGTGSTPAATPAVAGEVIRLHILADSDSEQDQAIKLALRDTLLPYLTAATLGANSKEEALTMLTGQCAFLTEIATCALQEQHAGYTATVSVERVYFPIRIYGSQTYLSADAVLFPPGFYDSVQVILGSGQGHNWWCLAYPSLCFIDSAYDYIPKDSDIYKIKIGTMKEDTLKKLFYGKDRPFPIPSGDFAIDSSTLGQTEEINVHVSFKLWELLKSLFQEKQK